MAKVIRLVHLCSVAVLLALTLPPVAPAAEPATAPQIAGRLRNAANASEFPFTRIVEAGLAPGSIFVVFGEALGPDELIQASVPYPTRLPAGPHGTQVLFRHIETGEVFEAPLLYSWHTQVAGIIPSQLPLGPAEVQLLHSGLRSETLPLEIVETRPALFTVSQTGLGAGVIQNYESPTVQPVNSLSRPAKPGQYIVLWGTGLGAIDGPDSITPPVGNIRDDVQVRIGGVLVPATYAGRAPGFPGVDQYNARVPDDGSVAFGCYVPVSINTETVVSPSVTMAISDVPGECDHPWGLSAEKLSDLDDGGTVSFLTTMIDQFSASATVAQADTFGLGQQFGPVGRLSGYPPVFGEEDGCTFIPFSTGSFIEVDFPTPTSRPTLPGLSTLDFGGELRLVKSDNSELELTALDPQSTQFFGSIPVPNDPNAEFFGQGPWVLVANGGADVPAFEIEIQRPFDLDDPLPETIKVGAELQLTWDGAPFESSDVVSVDIFRAQAEGEEPVVGPRIVCETPASAGSLVVPTLGLPAGSEIAWRIGTRIAPREIEVPGIDHAQVIAPSMITATMTVVQ